MAKVPQFKTINDFNLEEADVKKALEKFKNEGKLKDVNTGHMVYQGKKQLKIGDLDETEMSIFKKEFA